MSVIESVERVNQQHYLYLYFRRVFPLLAQLSDNHEDAKEEVTHFERLWVLSKFIVAKSPMKPPVPVPVLTCSAYQVGK